MFRIMMFYFNILPLTQSLSDRTACPSDKGEPYHKYKTRYQHTQHHKYADDKTRSNSRAERQPENMAGNLQTENSTNE